MTTARPNVVVIVGHLPRSNCRECGVPTCMAFAAQVVKGERTLGECPYVDPSVAEQYGEAVTIDRSGEEAQRQRMEALKSGVAAVDFAEAAPRLGGSVSEDRIAIPCLGRIFELDHDGELYSLCHVNTWVHVPLLHYVTSASGADPTGDWIHFAELEGSKDWRRYFEHRCEEAFKELADDHPQLIADVMELFDGKPPSGEMAVKAPKADWSLLLYPLPKVPLLVCYWNTDGDFESQLSLLYDRSVDELLNAESIWSLTRGIVEMCKRIIWRHTHAEG